MASAELVHLPTTQTPTARAKHSRLGAALANGKPVTVLILFLLTRPFLTLLPGRPLDIAGAFTLLLYLTTVPYVLNKRRSFVWLIKQDGLLIFLVALVPLSVLWSNDLASTLASAVVFLGATYFGVYLALRYSIRTQVTLLFVALGTAALLSVLLALFLPRYGVWGEIPSRPWIGIYEHKNTLGRNMTLFGATCLALMGIWRPAWVPRLGFVLALALTVLARSATPLVVLAAIALLLPFYRVLRVRLTRATPVVVMVGVLALALALLYLAMHYETARIAFFTALGRDPNQNTFGVRLVIWSTVLPDIRAHWLLGYGFDGYWRGGKTIYFQSPDGWITNHAHNGFLEILLQFGFVGLLPLLAHIAVNVRRSITLIRRRWVWEGSWMLTYITMLLLFSVTYSPLLGKLSILWAVYVTLTLSACSLLRRPRHHPASSTIHPSAPIPAPTG